MRYSAHDGDVAVEVVGGHHREDRFERRVRPDRGRDEQLVGAQVGDAEHADASVRVRQRRRPRDQVRAVLSLLGAEHFEGTARGAGAANVDHYLDVAPLDEVGRRAAADLRGWRRRFLPVGGDGHQHGEGARGGLAGGRLGRVVDVGAKDDAVAHRHRDVVPHADAVAGRPRGPRRLKG